MPQTEGREQRDIDILQEWYQFASKQPGFIGAVLRQQRTQFTQTEEQQRTQLGIYGTTYDPIWIHLQGMPLPRNGIYFEHDIIKIARYVEQQTLSRYQITITINHANLRQLLTRGEDKPIP